MAAADTCVYITPAEPVLAWCTGRLNDEAGTRLRYQYSAEKLIEAARLDKQAADIRARLFSREVKALKTHNGKLREDFDKLVIITACARAYASELAKEMPKIEEELKVLHEQMEETRRAADGRSSPSDGFVES